MKKALITGITGQDGAYLSKLLLEKGYKVYGLMRRLSTAQIWRLEELGIAHEIEYIDGDMTDESSLFSAVQRSTPEEIYNLAGQSFVGTSWVQPILTNEVNSIGFLKLLEAARFMAPHARIYQASTSEMFGNSEGYLVQNEHTPFAPTSPYAISKLHAHWTAVNYRHSYGMYVASGILFNHESPLRGLDFVTRKITHGVAQIALGKAQVITLGNLESKRDWGFAGDYVDAMWKMLQQEKAEELVIATGTTRSIAEFCEAAFAHVGIKDWRSHVHTSEKFMRPSEVHVLQGDASKAKNLLGWEARTSFEELVQMMVDADMKRSSSTL